MLLEIDLSYDSVDMQTEACNIRVSIDMLARRALHYLNQCFCLLRDFFYKKCELLYLKKKQVNWDLKICQK